MTREKVCPIAGCGKEIPRMGNVVCDDRIVQCSDEDLRVCIELNE